MRNVIHPKSFEEEIDHLDLFISDNIFPENERKSMQVFKDFLLSEESINHLGRYVFVKDGEIFNRSFETVQDSFEHECLFGSLVFQISKNI